MVQVVEMTYHEKVKMYMKCKKRDLVEMLIECNNNINQLSQQSKPTRYESDTVTLDAVTSLTYTYAG